MMNLTLVAQQLEIPLEQLKSICQVLKIEIVKNAVTPNDKQKIQEFITACKNQQITIEQGLLELQQLQKEAQTQQKALGERFNVEVFINSLDQWNQASPRVSDAFPKKYADALKKGLKGKEAILWARVEAFRKRNGELKAGNSRVGLFSICLNPKNIYYTNRLQQFPMWSERWRWNCIALDQKRRLEAINKVWLKKTNNLIN